MSKVTILAALMLLFTHFAPGQAQARRHRGMSLADTVTESVIARIDAALVAPPKDEEVCFSPDEPCDIKLIKFIEGAQSSIEVAIFDLNLKPLAAKLLGKSKTVTVRVVVDRRQAKGQHSLVPELIRQGVNIRYGRQRGIMHNKFVVVDGKAVEVGSFNYTNHASKANEENQLYLTKPAVVERYRKRFEKLWSKGKSPGA
jgi:phosphatidylserine/phosphatidylglycerophosphate/cardiolipin synthase-like enzyme